MSKRTSIFVLFKEYSNPAERKKSAPYIQDSVEYLEHQDALLKDWNDVADVLKYFSYELANRYYDEDNLKGLLEVAELFPSEYPMAVETVFAEMQSLGLTPRSTAPIAKTEAYFWGTDEVTNGVLGDMARRELEHLQTLSRIKKDVRHQLLPKDKEYEPCVLLQHGAIVAPGGVIDITMSGGRKVSLLSVSDIVSLHEWLSLHRFPSRHYSYNEKHGDAHHPAKNHSDRHHGSIPSAQLLTTCGNTKALLKKAVGESIEGDLWYYDDKKKNYIYFENQGDTPQHEYHAYHLQKGDKNYDKINFEKLKLVQPHICY